MHHDVTIEIPAGSRVKYEINEETGRLHLDRILFTAMQYPTNYGYFDNTLGEDGDPLDALVYLPGFDLVPNVVVGARPIGMLSMTGDGGGDDKLLRARTDPRGGDSEALGALSAYLLGEVEHFCARDTDLATG